MAQPAATANYGVSEQGTLVYVTREEAQSRLRSLVWVDRQGREEPLAAPPRSYLYPRLSPDGTRLAISMEDQQADIWVWDLARNTLTRITFNPGADAVSRLDTGRPAAAVQLSCRWTRECVLAGSGRLGVARTACRE